MERGRKRELCELLSLTSAVITYWEFLSTLFSVQGKDFLQSGLCVGFLSSGHSVHYEKEALDMLHFGVDMREYPTGLSPLFCCAVSEERRTVAPQERKLRERAAGEICANVKFSHLCQMTGSLSCHFVGRPVARDLIIIWRVCGKL